MKFLFDLFPIILFFVAFKFGDIYTATIVAMVATVRVVYFHGSTGDRGNGCHGF